MKINPKLTVTKVEAAVRKSCRDCSNPGFCIECGTKTDGVEPDARNYECKKCGKYAVYGAEELLFHLA